MIFLTSPRTHLQTHSGEILMSAASWNMAGEPPEIILPVAANRAVSIYPKLWILNSRLSWLMKKSPDYSSAKKCDKMRQLENAWGVATGRSNAKNAVKSCVSQQFGAQKSIKVSPFNQRARNSSSLRQSGPGWWLWTTTRFAEQSDRPSDRDFQALKIMVIKWIFVTNQ